MNNPNAEIAQVKPGDDVFYTGDMANDSEWLIVEENVGGHFLVLANVDRTHVFHLPPHMVGSVYRGHCDPRYVSGEAVRTYRASNR